jgi:hypothetical protein
MKELLCRLLVFLTFVLAPACAAALEAPVILTHQVTSSFQGATGVTYNYAIHLQNRGDSAITNLDLALVPRPALMTRGPVLTLGYLGPSESADLEMVLELAPSPDSEAIAHAPLSFAGKYIDARGVPVEFPVTSHPSLTGGAK